MASKPKEFAALAPGDAAILKVDGDTIAAFKDEDGGIHAVSAACPYGLPDRLERNRPDVGLPLPRLALHSGQQGNARPGHATAQALCARLTLAGPVAWKQIEREKGARARPGQLEGNEERHVPGRDPGEAVRQASGGSDRGIGEAGR